MHDHVDVGGVAEFAKFHRRELHLCRPAAGEQVDVLRTVGFDAAIDVVRDLGEEQLIGGLGQHAGHVECDIAGAKHSDRLGLERPFGVDVRVPVVPGHKIGGAMRTAQVDAGDLDLAVLVGTGREDYRVVELLEVVQFEVGAVVDVAEEPDVVLGKDTPQGLDDFLDTRVVGSNAITDEAERCWIAFDDVYAYINVGLGEDVGGVNARRTCANDGDPQLPVHACSRSLVGSSTERNPSNSVSPTRRCRTSRSSSFPSREARWSSHRATPSSDPCALARCGP